MITGLFIFKTAYFINKKPEGVPSGKIFLFEIIPVLSQIGF